MVTRKSVKFKTNKQRNQHWSCKWFLYDTYTGSNVHKRMWKTEHTAFEDHVSILIHFSHYWWLWECLSVKSSCKNIPVRKSLCSHTFHQNFSWSAVNEKATKSVYTKFHRWIIFLTVNWYYHSTLMCPVDIYVSFWMSKEM